MNSAIVPEGKIVYGYGGKKFTAGMTIKDTQTSPEVIKKLNSKAKPKISNLPTGKPKRKYTRKKIELSDDC